MKKSLFTALTIMAFCGVATAKTIEFEENIKNTTEEKQVFFDADCDGARFVAYADARNAGFSHEDASGMAYSVYFMCMGLSDPLPQ